MNGTSIARNQAPITKNIEQNGYSLLIRLRQGERAFARNYSQNFPLSVRNGCNGQSIHEKSISKPLPNVSASLGYNTPCFEAQPTRRPSPVLLLK